MVGFREPRRTFLAGVATAGLSATAGCSQLFGRGDRGGASGVEGGAKSTHAVQTWDVADLPITVGFTHPTPMVSGVKAVLVVTVSVEKGGFARTNELADPFVRLTLDGCRVERVFPGDYPVTAHRLTGGDGAVGTGVRAPWQGGKTATFSLAAVPETEAVTATVTVGGRSGSTDSRESFTAGLPVTDEPRGYLTPQQFGLAARRRSRIMQSKAALLARSQSFTGEVAAGMRESVMAVGTGSNLMLVEGALGNVVSISGAVGPWMWEMTNQYKTIFQGMFDGEYLALPDIRELDLSAVDFAAPGMATILSNLEDISGDFVRYTDQTIDPSLARNRGIVYFATLSDMARQEADAWRRVSQASDTWASPDVPVARRLLVDQLNVIAGDGMGRTWLSGPDRTYEIERRLRSNADAADQDPRLAVDGDEHNLLSELNAFVTARNVVRPNLLSVAKSIEHFTRGERTRIRRFVDLVDGKRAAATPTRTPRGTRTVTPAHTITPESGARPVKLVWETDDRRDSRGEAVALSRSGRTALLGAYADEDPNGEYSGSVSVFERDEEEWDHRTELAAADGDDGDKFGESVCLAADGSIAVVGADEDEDPNGYRAGSAYVFESTSGGWEQRTKLSAPEGGNGELFGLAVAASRDGETVFVGAPGTDKSRGAVHVYSNDGSTWQHETRLDAPDRDSFDRFGRAVDCDDAGDRVVVGAPWDEDPGAERTGSAYVFVRSSGQGWYRERKLTAGDGNEDDQFGYAVALSTAGRTALVGARNEEDESGPEAGAAYVYRRDGEAWRSEAKLVGSDTDEDDRLGFATALARDGEMAVVGSFGEDDPNGDHAGAIYVFKHHRGDWAETAKLVAPDGDSHDKLGSAVAVSADGSTVLGGAPEDEQANGAGYVFEGPGS